MAKKLMKDLMIGLQHRPGSLAEMGEALGKAGINIEGVCGITYRGEGGVHILVDDPDAVKKVLSEKKIEVMSEREVLVVNITDKPGELGKKAQALAAAGVNIEMVYLATGDRLVLGVDDMEKAKEVMK